MPTKPFYNWEMWKRLQLRERLNSLGCNIEGYRGSGITIAVSRSGYQSVFALMREYGLESKTSWYFPLGSDNPPKDLRWNGDYSGRPSFWLFIHFVPEELN